MKPAFHTVAYMLMPENKDNHSIISSVSLPENENKQLWASPVTTCHSQEIFLLPRTYYHWEESGFFVRCRKQDWQDTQMHHWTHCAPKFCKVANLFQGWRNKTLSQEWSGAKLRSALSLERAPLAKIATSPIHCFHCLNHAAHCAAIVLFVSFLCFAVCSY